MSAIFCQGQNQFMYEFQSICRKKIALVVTNIGAAGDIRIYAGKIILNEKARYYFVNSTEHWEVEIEKEIITKLTPVQHGLKDIMLGTDYFFKMEITELKPSLFMQSVLNA